MEMHIKHKRRRREKRAIGSMLAIYSSVRNDVEEIEMKQMDRSRHQADRLNQSETHHVIARHHLKLRTPPFKTILLAALFSFIVGLTLTLTITTTIAAASSTPNQIVLLEANHNGKSSNINNNLTRFQQALDNQQTPTSATPQQSHILASFSTPKQAINITHVTYDPLYDTVYLGVTNAIYQLSGNDLSEQHEQTTGPVFDNPSCGITECLGYEDYMKPTQNINKILVIDYQHRKLLSCGSTKQGACRRYQLNNIAQKEDLISMAVAANDDNSSTYAFIAPARYTYDPSSSSLSSSSPSSSSSSISSNTSHQQQQVLYVAATYTKVGQSRDLLVPAIGTRTLDDGPNLLKLYENSFLDSARIDINSHLRDYFLVNYLYGFASSNYIYFVTLQKKATSRDYEELGYHTRLARICITDSSYNSYTEVDLKCLPNKRKSPTTTSRQHHHQQAPSEYPLLQDAILVDAGSDLLRSLAKNDQSAPLSTDFFFNNPSSGSASSDDNKVLLGVFSSARDHTQHPGEHSALCAFSLSQIEEKFNDNIHNCYTGKMQSRNMEYIAGNVQECPKSGQGGNVVNFCHETLKINGTLPIVSEASIQFLNTTLTAITATSQVNSNVKNIYSDQLANEFLGYSNNSSKQSAAGGIPSISSHQNAGSQQQQQQQQNTVVFMGTSNGHVKKVLLNNASNGIEFEDIQLDTNPILSDLHLHSSGQQLIVATPYKVMKIPTHNCAQYSTCRECSQSKNPYCGWCSLKRSCTTRNECISSGYGESVAAAATATVAVATTPPIVVGTIRNSMGGQPESGSSSASKQLKWISSESAGKCIDLQSIVPDRMPITSLGKVDLYIDRLPRLPKEHSYKCIFDRKEQTTATPMSYGLSCPLPKVMHRPKIQPGRDHAVVDLAVRSSETNTDFLNGKITFFECQLHTTCKDCLTTNWGCNWCLNENICLFNTSKCEKTGQARAQENSLVQLVGGGGGQRGPTTSGLLSTAPPTPTITISNGANQRSSLSLTTISSSNGASSLIQTTPNQRSISGNTINQVNQCPTFDVGHKQDILIADGSEKELTIRVKNMPQFKGNIQCIVEIENDKIPLKARIEEDRVICENSTYSYAADVGLLNGQLVVIYSDNNIFIDRTNFTMYKCHLLGAYLNRPDCSLCQRIDPRFQCVWCSGSCHHRSRCTERPDDTCPPPRIDYIHPLSGPALGGTRVTIEGSNLGQTFEEIANRVTIGNVPCKPVEDEYRPSNRIVCLTGSVISRSYLGASQNRPRPAMADGNFELASGGPDVMLGDVMVGNKAGYSIGPSKFQFKSIQLYDYQPRYGPQSGGTRITLTGMNLNIGSSVQVFLDELVCLVEPSLVTAEQIVCKTSASRHPSRAIRQLKLVIDDAQIIRDDNVFYYRQDPTIGRITPLRSYLSGGRPINVYGSNLTSVQMPRMAILDAVGKKINESTCILQDDSWMQCPSPAVSLPMMELEWNEQHIGQYEPQQQQISSSTWTPLGLNGPQVPQVATTGQIKFSTATATTTSLQQATPQSFNGQQFQQQLQQQQEESIKFRLSFIMDNVWRLRDLQANHPSLSTEITYTSDPKLYPFASAQYKSAQELSSTNGMQVGSSETQVTGGYQQSYQVDSDTYLLQPAEPLLVLHGEHLRAAVSEFEITVTVGQDLCNLTQLSHTKLVCLMPLDHMATPTDEEGHQTQRSLPLVVVRIGFNLRYELGYVQYHPMLVDQIVQALANSSDQLSPLMRPTYLQYMPRENETILQKISTLITTSLLVLLYVALGSILLALVYSTLSFGYRLKRRTYFRQEYRRIQSKIDSLEKSVKGECRLASMALHGDLNELVRHVDLTGIPLLSAKQYIMKVFFPGMNNHPLLVNGSNNGSMLMNVDVEQMDAGNRLVAGANNMLGSPDGNSNPFGRLIGQTQQAPTMSIQHPLKTSSGIPMEYFERLILTKPFLITFINTLEAQPSFTIRDKVNVASLIMIILVDRLDYATDIMRTLLFQLVGKSVNQCNQTALNSLESKLTNRTSGVQNKSLTRRASNLLGGLPIGKASRATAATAATTTKRATGLGKMVGGSASSLMASTTVAAQVLLARVGNKTSPLQPQTAAANYLAKQKNLTGGLGSATLSHGHCISTTAFNQRNSMVHTIGGARGSLGRRQQHSATSTHHQHKSTSSSSSSNAIQGEGGQSHLMLRRTDSVVEKMLTNWLALNMYDHFRGPLGQSLYMMFEALRCQLDRGPVDSISGDAYYSLNENKLLREPHIQFEMVNLYVIVDTDILQPNASSPSARNNAAAANNTSSSSNNLLLDSNPQPLGQANYNLQSQSFYDDASGGAGATMSANRIYTTSNTITLALRVLDCDTISQVKGKILNALYRNSPYSARMGVNDVELSLRRQQPPPPPPPPPPPQHHQHQHQQPLMGPAHSGGGQYFTVTLLDEDYSSVAMYNGVKRINTLRHYGVTDQAIMMLNKCRQSLSSATINNNNNQRGNLMCNSGTRTTLTDMLDEHYNNPYSEIQYGPVANNNHRPPRNGIKSWHLTRSDDCRVAAAGGAQVSDGHSHDSSPSSHSPSMMLLGNEGLNQASASSYTHNTLGHNSNQAGIRFNGTINNGHHHHQHQQQQYYHPSSSSTSSTGNVMDTHSTSANSSSMNVTNMLMKSRSGGEQPIYCQIGSTTAPSHHGGASSGYYCQIGPNNVAGNNSGGLTECRNQACEVKNGPCLQEQNLAHTYLARMLTSKGTVQNYLDDFFKTILSARPNTMAPPSINEEYNFNTVLCGDPADNTSRRDMTTGACPPAVKWLFDLLDEAAMENGITDQNVVHAWKSNAFLLRFWVNFIKNPNYILDVEKTTTMDATLSVVAQTLMDSCSVNDHKLNKESTCNKLLFAKDIPKYKGLVKRFYQDIASMRPVSDQEMVKQMSSLSINNSGRFDTNLALKELCVYAVNHGVELMGALNNDFTCQQLDLSQQLEQCFRSFTIFEAYR